ncbi:hypothetical protein D3C78_1389730 [compost metagenome]
MDRPLFSDHWLDRSISGDTLGRRPRAWYSSSSACAEGGKAPGRRPICWRRAVKPCCRVRLRSASKSARSSCRRRCNQAEGVRLFRPCRVKAMALRPRSAGVSSRKTGISMVHAPLRTGAVTTLIGPTLVRP